VEAAKPEIDDDDDDNDDGLDYIHSRAHDFITQPSCVHGALW